MSCIPPVIVCDRDGEGNTDNSANHTKNDGSKSAVPKYITQKQPSTDTPAQRAQCLVHIAAQKQPSTDTHQGGEGLGFLGGLRHGAELEGAAPPRPHRSHTPTLRRKYWTDMLGKRLWGTKACPHDQMPQCCGAVVNATNESTYTKKI